MIEEPWLVSYVPVTGRTFLDVGANHGTWSHWLAKSYDQVIAIEPNLDCQPYLIGKNIWVHWAAAWNKREIREFNPGPRDCYIPRGVANYFGETESKPEKVICFALDELELKDVDLIKIDTEGSEIQVIEGAVQTIVKSHPQLIIEIHHADNDSPIRAMLPGYKFEVVRHPFYQEYQDLYPHHYWLIATP